MHSRFLAVSLIFFGLVAIAQPSPDGVVIDKIIAKVDDYIVLKSDLERSYLDYLSQGQARNEQAKCNILQSLVVSSALVVHTGFKFATNIKRSIFDVRNRQNQEMP